MSNERKCKNNNINNKINHQESRLEKNRTSTIQFQNWDIYKNISKLSYNKIPRLKKVMKKKGNL